jgi:hypothetical protein
VHDFRLTSSALTCISLILITVGCGGGAGSSGGTGSGTTGGGSTAEVPSAAVSIYVTQDNVGFGPPQPSSILQFSRTTSGSVSPTSTITGPADVIFNAVNVDATGNLYVGGEMYNSNPNAGPGGVDILVYAPGATGKATPERTITPAGLEVLANNPISALALDASGNLYVAAAVAVGSGPTGRIYSGISVFSPTANGGAAPSRVLAGSATTMGTSNQIALDSMGNIYIANVNPLGPASILIFKSGATGNVAPDSILSGSNTTIYYAQGVAVDSAGNIYVASLAQNTIPNSPPLGGTPSILEFGAGSTGNVAPTRIISGSATTMGELGNLRVDSAGNIYVLSENEQGSDNILKFAPGATGNVAPIVSISSTAFLQLGGSIAVQ